MIVVADTSPLNYLIQIELDRLLPLLYQRILVTSGVMEELGRAAAPLNVRLWLARKPSWVEVNTIGIPEQKLSFLDLGEREAIQLASERRADLLLMDERKGRLEAQRRALRVTGTLGVLLSAGEMGWIDPERAYRDLLANTTFRMSAALESRFLEQVPK